MRRRDFIGGLGSAFAAGPLFAFAQERMRVVGALAGVGDEAGMRPRYAAFEQALHELGWVGGRNIRVEYRWGEGRADNLRKHASELVGLRPDVLLASGGATLSQLLQATRTIPIVFNIVPDPVGSGFVESLSHPGGNATGFMQFEYSLSGKWVELLKQIAPNVTRVGVLWDPSIPAGIGQFAVIQSVAPALGLEVFPIDAREASELERRVQAFAARSNGGMIATANPSIIFHRELIAKLAERHGLPTVYSTRDNVVSGGLISYAGDFVDQYRRSAGYVHRILNGEKPADLPVQAPTKYDLVINVKTAKTLGLMVPPTLLARADEVIE